MSTMSAADARKRPSANYYTHPAGLAAKAQMYGYLPPGFHHKAQHQPLYYQHANPPVQTAHSKDMDDVSDSLGRINLQNGSYTATDKASPSRNQQASVYNNNSAFVNGMAHQPAHLGPLPLGAIPQAYVYNGQLMFAGQPMPLAAQSSGVPPSPGMYSAMGGHFDAQQGYAGYPHHMLNNHSPISQSWPSSRVPSGESMPSIITPRRDSTSSNEHDVPGTPFTQYTGYGGFRPAVAVTDHSPNSLYAWSTPSSARDMLGMGKLQGSPPTLSSRLQLLIQQHPAIPRAVPAPYSPTKPLDRSLENPHGVTNVYIRGLQPETTDDMLLQLVQRFGDIISSKSIIDHGTGSCKGYGFAKFHSYSAAEDCIRALHSLGYEVSFARESFYSQLKKLSDTNSTNLYISALPKNFNEHELSAIFHPYKVCSARILRDSSGHGRGVGFARFESREVCEEVCAKYSNYAVASKDDGVIHRIAIRFADSGEQKSLKGAAQTNLARQWRSSEYDSVTRSLATTPVHTARIGLATPSVTNVDSTSFDEYIRGSTGDNHTVDNHDDLHSQFTPSPSKEDNKENVRIEVTEETSGKEA